MHYLIYAANKHTGNQVDRWHAISRAHAERLWEDRLLDSRDLQNFWFIMVKVIEGQQQATVVEQPVAVWSVSNRAWVSTREDASLLERVS